MHSLAVRGPSGYEELVPLNPKFVSPSFLITLNNNEIVKQTPL